VTIGSNEVSLTSPTSTLAGTAFGALSGELRVGTLRGDSGLVATRPFANDDSEDIVVHSFSDGMFGGTVRLAPAGSNGKDRGTFIVRGTARQTLTGLFVSPDSPAGSDALQISKDVAVGHGATLTLASSGSLGKQTEGAIILAGGTFELDNRATNHPDRLRDADAGSTGVDTNGGGVFRLIGNSAGSNELAGRVQLGSPTNQRSGQLSIAVQHSAGAAAATALAFQSLSRDGSVPTSATVDFSASDANRAVLPLGQSGAAPRISFVTAPPLTNGLLRNTRNINSDVGWATVNGSAFATHGSNGIAPVPVSAPPAGNTVGNATENAEVRGDFTVSSGANGSYRMNSLRIEPSAGNQSFSVASGRSLETNAVLLAGDRDYTIAGPGFFAARYVYVDRATLALTAATGSHLVKSGDGMLDVRGAFTPSFTINAGSVRVPSDYGGLVQLRGGLLELTGGGTFARSVGVRGALNWQGADQFDNAITEDVGSGGFAAFGSDVTIDLNEAGPSGLLWESNGFVQAGHALIFGSRTADHRVTWRDNLSLSEASQTYNAREIRVNDNPFPPGTSRSSAASSPAERKAICSKPDRARWS